MLERERTSISLPSLRPNSIWEQCRPRDFVLVYHSLNIDEHWAGLRHQWCRKSGQPEQQGTPQGVQQGRWRWMEDAWWMSVGGKGTRVKRLYKMSDCEECERVWWLQWKSWWDNCLYSSKIGISPTSLLCTLSSYRIVLLLLHWASKRFIAVYRSDRVSF